MRLCVNRLLRHVTFRSQCGILSLNIYYILLTGQLMVQRVVEKYKQINLAVVSGCEDLSVVDIRWGVSRRETVSLSSHSSVESTHT